MADETIPNFKEETVYNWDGKEINKGEWIDHEEDKFLLGERQLSAALLAVIVVGSCVGLFLCMVVIS